MSISRRSATALIGLGLVLSAPSLSYAQDSAQNASAAAQESGAAVKHLAGAGVQTASAVSVVPAAIGATGSVAAGASVATPGVASVVVGAESAKGAAESAATARGPLPVTKKVIVAQPAPKVPYDAQNPATAPATPN